MWYLRDLMDACIRQIIFRAIVIFIIGFIIGFFVGCETPYTGFLGPEDIDSYVKNTGEDTVCLADGFDTVCIRTIPGPPGQNGKDGKNGVSIVGPRGKRGLRGKAGTPGKDGAILIVHTPYLLLETETDLFVAMVSHGIPVETRYRYVTPVADIEVPIGGGEPTITPKDESVSVTPVAPPIDDKTFTDDSIIWHVMYRNDAGQASVFVYPRCFNNPYHNPPRPPCENDFGITEALFFEISPGFDIELQGNREDVRTLLDLALTEDAAVLVHVGGVQGIVN